MFIFNTICQNKVDSGNKKGDRCTHGIKSNTMMNTVLKLLVSITTWVLRSPTLDLLTYAAGCGRIWF